MFSKRGTRATNYLVLLYAKSDWYLFCSRKSTLIAVVRCIAPDEHSYIAPLWPVLTPKLCGIAIFGNRHNTT